MAHLGEAGSIDEPREGAGRPQRRLRLFQGLVVGGGAVVAAFIAGGTVAFAHHIISTTPMPSSGTAGTTALKDSALVHGSTNNHVIFKLWAPSSCGSGSPAFTDTEHVLSPAPPNDGDSTVITAQSFTPQQAGTWQWTADLTDVNGNVISSSTCGQEPVDIAAGGSQGVTTGGTGGVTAPSTGAGGQLELGLIVMGSALAVAGVAEIGLRRSRRRSN